MDTHCFSGYFVPPYYDSLLAKLIVHADTRARAADHTAEALDQFHVTGIDTLVLPGLLAGSQGAILGSANVCPELSLEIVRLFTAGRLQEAWAVQNRLTRFWLAMSLGSFPAPVKAAMELLGLPAGVPRQPVAALGAEGRTLLRKELQVMEVLA